MMEVGDKIESLEIEKTVYQGFGLGFWNEYPIFVRYAFAGSVVSVEITAIKKKVAYAKIMEIIKKAPEEQVASCEVFGTCGGCDWLSMPYEEQVRIKDKLIEDMFCAYREHAIFSPIEKSPYSDRYRNKSYLPVGLRRKQPQIGIYARQSHEVITHQDCLIQPKLFDSISKAVLRYISDSNETVYSEHTGKGNLRHVGIRYSELTGEVLVVLVTKSRKLAFNKQLVHSLITEFPAIVGIIQNINTDVTNRILGFDDKVLYGVPYLNERLGDLTLQVHYRSFMQINWKQTKLLYDYIGSLLTLESRVIDAFCGIGSIGLYIADLVQHVEGIEIVSEAILDAEKNAQRNGIENCRFSVGSVEELLPVIIKKENYDVIILDPPRKGVEASALQAIGLAGTPMIIYVSCDPATQLRDIKLLEAYQYHVESIKPFDMFPHTWHIENVVVLRKK